MNKNVKIFTNNIEEAARKQVDEIAGHPLFQDVPIRIMPDVHSGAGCVIGFTSPIKEKAVVPNIIGVDLSCGVQGTLYMIPGGVNIDNRLYERVDKAIRERVPFGFSINNKKVYENFTFDAELKTACEMTGQDYARQQKAVGSLGGGNHFIEIGMSDDKQYLLASVHSGSRNFGWKVAEFYQKKAEANANHENKELCWIEGQDYDDYMWCSKVAHTFALISRAYMLKVVNDVLQEYGLWQAEDIESTHNYIDEKGIIRKGAINAEFGKGVIIPLNMRDGIILGVGKGNEDWNCSAPHGAGRVMSRTKAKKELSLQDYKYQMSGIWSSCISKNTLDESPMAYKPFDEIMANMSDTVDIKYRIKSVYNFKAEEK